jgi:2,3,4,5-tetrahydropyridine-2,6-dicarboxylate N-succinyltransferase
MLDDLTLPIQDKEAFQSFVDSMSEVILPIFAFGIGIPYYDLKKNLIAVRWMTLNKQENQGTYYSILHYLISKHPKQENDFLRCGIHEYEFSQEDCKKILEYLMPFSCDCNSHPNIDAVYYGSHYKDGIIISFYSKESTFFSEDTSSIPDAHFRLALLSRLHYQPRTISFNGIFGILPNLIWTNEGVYTLEDWNKIWYKQHLEYPLAQDKFPPMYWSNPAPLDVRVANTAMIRTGAHLAPGTTVIHYGFVNFNAGTLGKSMVEGRISAGTIIGKNTDVGAGAGFLGTLSGGNDIEMSAGENCLIGAMAECGVVLGDDCIIATGACFAQGTPIWEVIIDAAGVETNRNLRKIKDFNGHNNLVFWNNSTTGELEVRRRLIKTVELNSELHDN